MDISMETQDGKLAKHTQKKRVINHVDNHITLTSRSLDETWSQEKKIQLHFYESNAAENVVTTLEEFYIPNPITRVTS